MAGAAAALAVLALAAVGCGDEDGGGAGGPDARSELGGSARTKTLDRARTQRPGGPAAWVAHEARLGPGDSFRHTHEFAFVYTRRGRFVLRIGGRSRALREGEGAAVAEGASHRHSAGPDGGVLWEVRLAPPGAPAPPGPKTSRVFESEPLRGIPPSPTASFIEVSLPPRGGETTVHTHPGPEFIYQLAGRIDYQNAIVGTKKLGPGDAEGIPPGTPVQKRNPSARSTKFLSLFLVDPGRPFAPRATFETR
jgi:quercetin dioxygenase-like cupin family protein